MATDSRHAEVIASMRVVSVEEPMAGYKNRRAHCEFIEISRLNQELIARYLMRRQIDLCKGGRL